MYRVYFTFPMDSTVFDGEGCKKWAKETYDKLGADCLGYSVGLADLIETQPVYPNTFKAMVQFDFVGRIESFDAFDSNGREDKFLKILDAMCEFTDKAPTISGAFLAE